jgi:hypothetical protein
VVRDVRAEENSSRSQGKERGWGIAKIKYEKKRTKNEETPRTIVKSRVEDCKPEATQQQSGAKVDSESKTGSEPHLWRA